MQYIISTLSLTCAFQANKYSSARDVKDYLKLTHDLDFNDYYLSSSGRVIDDSEALVLNCLNNATLTVNFRLRGGKVHGSLASAGKVKSSTPKIDKQEKPRKKTGRAKRRIQYNRRFGNVSLSFGGRRKGPNSNKK
ncbi:40S ribosomal protein S30 [Intoshia linei]|uniref:40S ribosomal protein S30 n=1 Tax=Intoshia linei TaxID=1819745 RepID=A0A177BCF8_9BILA|nr:40S ribosomal protein S30 [Intoshia linei]